MAAVAASLTSKDFLGRDIVAAWLLTATPTASATTTDTGDIFTINAHGLANGDEIVLQSLTTTTGPSTGVTYFVIGATTNTFQISATYGGSAVALTSDGSATLKAITYTEIYYTNSIQPDVTTKEITFEGSGQTETYSSATGFTVKIAPDSLSLTAMERAFAKTIGTSALPRGMTGAMGLLSSTDGQGVTAGLMVKTASKGRTTAGVEGSADLYFYVPNGTLTISGIAKAQTSDKLNGLELSLTASRATTNVAGGALPASISGHFAGYLWN